jgi:hypothetical protein
MADQKFFACFEISLPVTSTTTEPLRRAVAFCVRSGVTSKALMLGSGQPGRSADRARAFASEFSEKLTHLIAATVVCGALWRKLCRNSQLSRAIPESRHSG